MKLAIEKAKLATTPELFLRHAGYSYHANRNGEASFVRPFGRTPYPQFHIYLIEENDKIIFNLHLDQKRPSYPGAHAHSGEYEGAIVEQELKRLKEFIS